MTKEQLYENLNYVNHSREKRMHYANLMIANPELLPKLLEVLFMVDDKISPRAAWVLEFMCNQNINSIIPYLDVFTKSIHKVHLDSAVRPVAKICELLTISYYSKNIPIIKTALQPKHKERITETCFDYLINDEKIAPKAYAMQALFLLGRDYDWIHPELKIILERDCQIQSSGFKARAKHILKKIGKTTI